jgi:hypothetical protein
VIILAAAVILGTPALAAAAAMPILY